jgi:hypothetical protein
VAGVAAGGLGASLSQSSQVNPLSPLATGELAACCGSAMLPEFRPPMSSLPVFSITASVGTRTRTVCTNSESSTLPGICSAGHPGFSLEGERQT